MDKLTPSAQRTLGALNAGPGNVHELAERTGRSRSTTDKAIAELAKAGLIVKVDDGGDPADGAPARWQLATPASTDDPTTPQAVNGDDSDTEAEAPATAETATPSEAADPSDPRPAPDDGDNDSVPATGARSDTQAESDGDTTPDSQTQQDGTAEPDGNGEQTAIEAQPPKLCRGCQAQMPKICECCWQKTPAYCGTCRRTMPQVRRGEPGEPVILSNGLPKLRPGELEAMVEKVMREQPLPAFAGVVGWTGGRLAIHIPGRSPGAMTNAMRKFTKEGKAELIGEDPERYQLTDVAQPDDGSNNDIGNHGPDQMNLTDATTTAAAESQPGTAA